MNAVEIKLADHPEQAAVIVRETIQKVYLHYYPSGAVKFFLDFPAERMYLKRGCQITSYEKIETENGDFLCYHTMKKEKPE